MGKQKISELAKEIHTTTKVLVEKIKGMGIDVKSSSSSVTEEEKELILKNLGIKRDAKHGENADTLEKKEVKKKVSGPTIIRKREVFLDDNGEEITRDSINHIEPKKSRHTQVKVDDGNSGLRMGLSHDDNKVRIVKAEKEKTEEPVMPRIVKKGKAETTPQNEEIPAAPVLLKKKKKAEPEVSTETKEVVQEKVDEVKENMTADKPVAEEKKPTEEVAKKEAISEIDKSAKQEKVEKTTDKVAKEVENKRPQKPRSEQSKDGKPQHERHGTDRNRGDRQQNNRGNNFNKKNVVDKMDLSTVVRDEPQRSAEEFGLSKQKEQQKYIKKDQKRESTRNNNSNIKSRPAANLGKRDLKGIAKHGMDYDEMIGGNKRRKKNKKVEVQQPKYVPPVVNITDITLPEVMTVKELAEMLKKTSAEIIKKLMALGVMATLNSTLDFDTAALITDEYGITATQQVVISVEERLFDDEEDEDESLLVPRDPVVVVMGHVDHGKTSLLDAIRDTNVISGEAGGITQHIGAYKVRVGDRSLCFLDTPGHEAFTAMRARGAQVTDVAILVVAADDGVMPQTIEAINHAKAAETKIVVAINKIDKDGANPERVKTELLEHGVILSEYGGDTEAVEISAKKRLNIKELLEIVCLEADLLDLKANPNKQAKGTIIEAKLDKGRGAVATMLVQRGTLRAGDAIVTGTTTGRIRAMTNDKGKQIKKAGPSTPVEIIGLPEVPEAGELFYVVEDEKLAKQLVEKRKLEAREIAMKSSSKVSLEQLFAQIQEGEVKDLNIIVKADVQGSVEAVKQSLEKLSNDEVRVKVIHGGVGAISESDVTLAQVSNAIIIGFNVRPGLNIDEMAKEAGVDMKMYTVIYQAIDDIEKAMKGMLAPEYEEVVIGHAEVRQLWKVSGVGTIAGSYVLDGKVTRSAKVRVVRDGIVITEGAVDTLRRFKDDVKEVATGYECGIMLENFNDIKEGDVIEAFEMREIER